MKWGKYLFSEPRIQHAGNADEYLIPNSRYTVAGYDAETNTTIYDFQASFCYGYVPLYPYVNKNSECPLGHPKIIFQSGHTDISHYFGIVQCTALPSPWTLSFRAPTPTKLQGHLFAMSQLWTRRNVQTYARTKLRVKPYWQTASNNRDLVRARTRQGCGEEIQDSPHPQSVAFPWNSERALCQLCQHLA